MQEQNINFNVFKNKKNLNKNKQYGKIMIVLNQNHYILIHYQKLFHVINLVKYIFVFYLISDNFSIC